MLDSPTFKVVVTQRPDGWQASVADLPHVDVVERALAPLLLAIRRAIGHACGLPAAHHDTIAIEFRFDTGDPALDAEAATVRAHRALFATLPDRGTVLARRYRAAGLSGPDIAELLDLSPQRVSQMAPRSTHTRADADLTREEVPHGLA
ncbi:MAG TPA: hypothetical protein VK506_05325 [Conexibacter sp.]|nr:hypothetical protein [Conexibacter sp.]